jgi:hypothetical protein
MLATWSFCTRETDWIVSVPEKVIESFEFVEHSNFSVPQVLPASPLLWRCLLELAASRKGSYLGAPFECKFPTMWWVRGFHLPVITQSCRFLLPSPFNCTFWTFESGILRTVLHFYRLQKLPMKCSLVFINRWKDSCISWSHCIVYQTEQSLHLMSFSLMEIGSRYHILLKQKKFKNLRMAFLCMCKAYRGLTHKIIICLKIQLHFCSLWSKQQYEEETNFSVCFLNF